jgi:hypothetical protein
MRRTRQIPDREKKPKPPIKIDYERPIIKEFLK